MSWIGSASPYFMHDLNRLHNGIKCLGLSLPFDMPLSCHRSTTATKFCLGKLKGQFQTMDITDIWDTFWDVLRILS